MARNYSYTNRRQSNSSVSSKNGTRRYQSTTNDSGIDIGYTESPLTTSNFTSPNSKIFSVDDHTEKIDDDKPISIQRTRVLGNKMYQQAYVSCVNHPSAFFLQLAFDIPEYEKLHQEMSALYLNQPQIVPPIALKRGEFCVAKYENVFYRARVISQQRRNENVKYDVILIDIGERVKLDSINIYSLQRRFARLPAQAVPCSLAKTLPLDNTQFYNEDVIELFQKLALNKYVDATFYPKSDRDFWPLCFVDLKTSDEQIDIRQRMYELGSIRQVENEEVNKEFHHLLHYDDYIIYSIPHEDDIMLDNDDQ